MRGQTEFNILLVLAVVTQLINITYVDGLQNDFSNMVLEVVTENGSYAADYSTVSMERGGWIIVNATLPEDGDYSINVLSQAEEGFPSEFDPSIIEISYQPGLKSDFSNLVIHLEGPDGITSVGYSPVSMSDGEWIIIGLDRKPGPDEDIVILANLDNLENLEGVLPGDEETETAADDPVQQPAEPVNETSAQQPGPEPQGEIPNPIQGESLVDTNPVLGDIVRGIREDLANQTDYNFTEMFHPETAPEGFQINIFNSEEAKTRIKGAKKVGTLKKFDYLFTPEGYPVLEMRFRDLEVVEGENGEIGMESLSPDLFENRLPLQAYAIDPTSLTFTEAEVTVTAKGNELYKCAEWDFESQTCNGEWVKIMRLTPGENYTIILNSTDPAYAEYWGDIEAPRCTTSESPCIAGSSLLMSRDHLATPEPNAPNTISDCHDGSFGDYLSDESIENITITDLNDSYFSPGDTVNVTVTAYCYNASDTVNIAYSNSTSSPFFIVVSSQSCPGSGLNTFSTEFTLNNTEGEHAVRAMIGFVVTPSTWCASSNYADNDDVAFQVGSDCVDLNDPGTFGSKLTNVGGDSYYMTDDITLCTGNYSVSTLYPLFRIYGDRTLDCGGSVITGTGFGTAVFSHSYDITVKNCIFQNFSTGIQTITLPVATAATDDWNATVASTAGMDELYDVAVDNENNYIMAGSLDSTAFVVKTTSEGDQIWNWSGGGTGYAVFRRVEIDADGNIVAGGHYNNSADSTSDPYLVKLAPNGTQIWNWTVSVSAYNDQYFGLAIDHDNNYLLGGRAAPPAGSILEWSLFKISDSGSQIWNWSYDPPSTGTDDEVIYSITVDQENNYVMSGLSSSSTRGYDWHIVKLTPSKSVVWNNTFSFTSGNDFPFDIVTTTSGAYGVSGSRIGSGHDIAMGFITHDGDLAFNSTWTYSSSTDYMRALTNAPDEGFFTAGLYYGGSGNGYDAFVNKHYGPIGLYWGKNYTISSGSDQFYGIAVDKKGDLIAVGRTSPSGNYDAYALKLINPKSSQATTIENVGIYGNHTTYLSFINDTGSATNLTIGYSPTAGKITYASLSNVNGTITSGNFIAAPDFVSMNASDTGDFNASADISVAVPSCGSLTYYKLSGFPQDRASIISGGTPYTPGSSSCSANVATFETTGGFSGYAADNGTTESQCPAIATSGTYQQNTSYTGANNVGGVNVCVDIAASNVVYDCNGYNITNNGTSNARGFYIHSGYTNVTVKNCAGISGYTYGIYSPSSTSNYFLNNTIITNTADGIYLSNSDYTTIAGSFIVNNTAKGIRILSGSDNVVIENSTLYGNDEDGIYIDSSNYINVTNVNISAHTPGGDSGMELRYTDYNNFKNINFNSNFYDIYFLDCDNSNFTNMNLTGTTNHYYPFYLNTGTSSNIFTNITVDSYLNYAFYGVSSSSNTLNNVVIHGAAGTGYAFSLSSAASTVINGGRVYDNNHDFYSTTTGALTVSNLIFDNDAGTWANYTNLSFTKTAGGTFEINWVASPASPPPTATPFHNMYVYIDNVSAFSFDSIAWGWTDGQASGFNENGLALFRYNGSTWNKIPATVNPASNNITVSGLSEFGYFGVFEVP